MIRFPRLALLSLIGLSVAAVLPAAASDLFAIDPNRQMIVQLDGMTGAERHVVPTPEPVSGGAEGLAAADGRLWFVNGNTSNVIYELDPADGSVVGSFAAPMIGAVDGLAFDDDTLFVLEPVTDTIHRLDPATGLSLGSCSTGLGALAGLAAEDGRLFAVLGFVMIAEIDPLTCAVLNGPFATPNGDFAVGLGFDGESLFVGGFLSQAIFRVDPADGSTLGTLDVGYLPSGLAALAGGATPTLEVEVDVKPGSCPNKINAKSKGVTPVAVLGSADFDVTQLDPESIQLAGVSPLRTHYEDTGTDSDCDRLVADGHMDLVMHFRTQALVAAMETQTGGLRESMVVTLALTADPLSDGTQVAGQDDVIVIGVARNEHEHHERREDRERRERPDGRGRR